MKTLLFTIVAVATLYVGAAKLDLEQLALPPEPAVKLTCKEHVCHARFSQNIVDPKQYVDFLSEIDYLTAKDTLYIHLAGYGGRADSMFQIIGVLNRSPAKVISVVEGGVYSAHAMIAISSDSMVIDKSSMFLFHKGSRGVSNEEACAEDKGKLDRGQDAFTKCMDFLSMVDSISERSAAILMQRVLTNQEIKLVFQGHDILISGEEMIDRLKGN